MNTLIRCLAPLALFTTSFAYGQTTLTAPAAGSELPNPTMDSDKPLEPQNCYPRGTVDASGRLPTDKPLCDEFKMNSAPDSPDVTPREVPKTIEAQPEGGRGSNAP